MACYACEKKFISHHQLQNHMNAVHQPKKFECVHCNKKFVKKNNWKQHHNKHKNIDAYKLYICAICRKPFTTSGLRNKHLKIRHSFLFNH